MAGDLLRYDFGQLVALAHEIRADKGKFINMHDDLKGYVGQLAAAWESDKASADYQAAQKRWDEAHNELLHVLETISKVVEDGAVSMKSQDDRNAMTWL